MNNSNLLMYTTRVLHMDRAETYKTLLVLCLWIERTVNIVDSDDVHISDYGETLPILML